MSRLRNILDGMRSAIELNPPQREYVGISGFGFETDAKALKSDISAVSDDMRHAIRDAKGKHVKKQDCKPQKQQRGA